MCISGGVPCKSKSASLTTFTLSEASVYETLHDVFLYRITMI
jgi:hypothetical protein